LRLVALKPQPRHLPELGIELNLVERFFRLFQPHQQCTDCCALAPGACAPAPAVEQHPAKDGERCSRSGRSQQDYRCRGQNWNGSTNTGYLMRSCTSFLVGGSPAAQRCINHSRTSSVVVSALSIKRVFTSASPSKCWTCPTFAAQSAALISWLACCGFNPQACCTHGRYSPWGSSATTRDRVLCKH